MAAAKISPLGLGGCLCFVRYQEGYGKNVPKIPSPWFHLACSTPDVSRESNLAVDTGRVCFAFLPSPSSPAFYATSQAYSSRHRVKQQGLPPSLWSALTNPPLRSLPIAILMLRILNTLNIRLGYLYRKKPILLPYEPLWIQRA